MNKKNDRADAEKIILKKTAEVWDKNAPLWAKSIEEGLDLINDVFAIPNYMAFIDDPKGMKVLDAGCGEGRVSRSLANRGATVTGLDISSGMLAEAKKREAKKPLRIEYVQGSFTNMDQFDDQSFDAVHSFSAYLESPNFQGAVKEAYRIIKPGGSFSFAIPHPCFLTKQFQVLSDDNNKQNRLAVNSYFLREPFVQRLQMPHKQGGAPALFNLPRFPRSLTIYMHQLLEAGFQVSGFREPRPSEKLAERFKMFQFWREHGALHLFVKAKKTNKII
ncbi:MAG: class I SAM-dependent methyltransferase [Magnetococcales bacterium]|nr:class I SAM-dependent methyltransferase [Magnetococcales bacterium]